MTSLTPAPPIRILVVDDHPVLRTGLLALIGAESDMEVVGEAEDGAEARAAYARLKPDVIIMDLQMPGMCGIEAIELIRRDDPRARIVVLTTYTGDVQAVSAFKAGASGYLLKTSARREMVSIIREVHAGRRRIPQEIAVEIALHAGDHPLSDREKHILRRAANGKANKQIASELAVTEDTIKSQLKSIFAKLQVGDRTHAVALAARRGIIEL